MANDECKCGEVTMTNVFAKMSTGVEVLLWEVQTRVTGVSSGKKMDVGSTQQGSGARWGSPNTVARLGWY
jgi:hypothetical protein